MRVFAPTCLLAVTFASGCLEPVRPRLGGPADAGICTDLKSVENVFVLWATPTRSDTTLYGAVIAPFHICLYRL